MWLINTKTYALQAFGNERSVPYAILSHTWGHDEVTFQDMQSLVRAQGQAGFSKIEETCRLAQAESLQYAWIDTCCIDKSSSAELSEAINSMYKWYQNSKVCYVFLNDIVITDPCHDEDGYRELAKNLRSCRWFTRGWCLQELIAPESINFYDAKGNLIGTKKELAAILTEITGIDSLVLKLTSEDQRRLLHATSVAAKMSWASRRQTTRIEDEAYSLIGLFGVQMPLLYGEGQNAFRRLQEHIIAQTSDHSILVWDRKTHNSKKFLAESATQFQHCGSVIRCDMTETEFNLSNEGIKTFLNTYIEGFDDRRIAILNCRYADDFNGRIFLRLLLEAPLSRDGYRQASLREYHHDAVRLSTEIPDNFFNTSEEKLLLYEPRSSGVSNIQRLNVVFAPSDTFLKYFQRIEATPQDYFHPQTHVFSIPNYDWLSQRSESVAASVTWAQSNGRGFQIVVERNMEIRRRIAYHVKLSKVQYASLASPEYAVTEQVSTIAKSGALSWENETVEVAVKEWSVEEELMHEVKLSFTTRSGNQAPA